MTSVDFGNMFFPESLLSVSEKNQWQNVFVLSQICCRIYRYFANTSLEPWIILVNRDWLNSIGRKIKSFVKFSLAEAVTHNIAMLFPTFSAKGLEEQQLLCWMDLHVLSYAVLT